MKFSTCWKPRGEPHWGTSYLWLAGLRETDLALTGCHTKLCQKAAGRGLSHKVPPQLLHVGSLSTACLVENNQCHLPLKPPFLSTQENVLKLRTPPLHNSSFHPGPPFHNNLQNQIRKLNKASLRCQDFPAKPTPQTLVVNSLKATSRKGAIKFKHMMMVQQVRE